MRLGLLTGGGDCPGLNAAIRAVVKSATNAGDEVIAFHHGWLGVVQDDAAPLSWAEAKDLIQAGGTILRTARYHPDLHEGGTEAVVATVKRRQLDALVVLGGDGTLLAALGIGALGVPIVGIPKTIDNDVPGVETCIGFDTAVATATEAIDRVHTTAESHDRLMVVEVMGRDTGWLALSAGVASGADAICVPEEATDLDMLAKALEHRHHAGSSSSVVVVAEGAAFAPEQHVTGSAGQAVADGLSRRTGFETRLTVLGHIQRGGTPTAADRLLATRAGVAAVRAAHDGDFGTLVSVLDDATEVVDLRVVQSGPRHVPVELVRVARALTIL